MNFEQTLYEYFNKTIRYMKVQPINLGGIASSGGGTGGPPGGYIGYLPQARVAYDYAELATDTTASGIAPSGASIVDNLNHIRYNIFTISGIVSELDSEFSNLNLTVSGIVASGIISGIDVYSSGIFVASGISKINFADNMFVVQVDSDTVNISTSASGSYSGASCVVFSGVYNEDLSDQLDGSETTFTISGNYIPNSVSVYINGLKQSRDSFSEVAGGIELTPILSSGENLLVDYVKAYSLESSHTHDDYVTLTYLENNYLTESETTSLLENKLDKNVTISGGIGTKITYDSDGLVTSGDNATTADIADSLDKRYVTDAQLVVISNTSGVNTGNQVLPTDQTIEVTDNVVNNVSTDKHGWFPKLPTPSGLYLRDDLTWATPSGAITLSELTDVNIPEPNDGDVLTFDSDTNTWISQYISVSGTGGSTTLSGLLDVSIINPSDGDSLVWDSDSSLWIASPIPSQTFALDDLTDVSIPSPSDGQILTFSGTGWVAEDPISSSIVRQTILTFTGAITVSGNPLRIYNQLGSNQTISKVFLAVGTAPTGASIIADIHKNGTTIFTNQGNRPNIASGEYTGYTETIDVPTWSGGEYLTAHVDQIGSSIAGSDLVVHIIHN